MRPGKRRRKDQLNEAQKRHNQCEVVHCEAILMEEKGKSVRPSFQMEVSLPCLRGASGHFCGWLLHALALS
jgi:hypothetical protein